MSSVSRYAAWRDALRRRRQQRVAQIGELSTTQVLRSLPNLPSSHQTTLVRFAASHRPVRLFWVDPKGERHHGYAIAAYSCHTEHTYPGHAFAVYLEEEEEGETLVASYRVLAGLSDSQSHLVDLTKLTARIHETITEARVICQLGHPALLPSYGEWEVSYSFSVPPLPPFTNFTNHTVYVWGDLSFDEYDFAKQRKVTNCKMNQLVPQVMIGRCLFDSNQHLVPQWKTFSTWVAQAQYYYQNHLGEEHGSRAMCGKVFDVVPHERMQSRFKLTSNGEMVVSIRSLDRPANVSVITVDRPFPGEDESSFRSWLEFFAQKQSAGEIKAEGAFDIEYKADEVDLNALRHMCPLEIHHAQFHQHPRASSSQEFAQAGWEVRGMNFNTRAPMVRFG